MDIPVFPFRSNELVAVGLFVNVMLPIAHHSNVELAARVNVEAPATLFMTIMLVDDVPAIVTAFVIVNDDTFKNNGAFKFNVAIVKEPLN